MKRCIIFLSLLVSSFLANGQGFLRADGVDIINDNGPVLLRSIGTGNWMIQEGYMMQSTGAKVNTHTQFRTKLEESIGKHKTEKFYKTWLANHFTKADLDSMKAWGFNGVRVALHYKWFTLPIEEEELIDGKMTNTWLETGFTYTDKLVEWCTENEMYLILDMHGAPGGQGKDANISDYDKHKPSLWESEENKDKLEKLWIELASRYKNEKWIGGYDLINEPNWGFAEGDHQNGCGCKENDAIWDLHERLIKAVRTVDQNHIVYISGNCWGNNYDGLDTHSLREVDDNMVITFHKYWNYNTDKSVQAWLDMREKFQLPLWMSEAGENSNTWFSDCISLFEKNNIGWSWWPVKKQRMNNVLKVKTPETYKALLKAWEEGKTLSVKDTYKAVMDYAEAHKNENCEVAYDVIYAMLHQPHTNETAPFKSHKIGEPILFADYDMGKNELAYFDNVSADYHIDKNSDWMVWNSGYVYRNDGVDIGLHEEIPFVGWTEKGEWMNYTLNIPSEATYKIDINYLAENKEGLVRLKVNGKSVQECKLSQTGNEWVTQSFEGIQLPKGQVELRVEIMEGGMKLKSFTILKTQKI
ncbi:cellulase family glycosylhydrolase [Sediminitomix flava]|uniref:Carbohydrate binding protein with CBM6 domain n=1 Tax=Sediminitomix flava TaxID=379075 RepID=A0A315Z0X5_SEDFL|nr:cellulase family glycosylhydrolase [Sediminitomix flava]PWJ36161.1 carbohydrate binding protein with CBM6 domain [Sediminitomix flava]